MTTFEEARAVVASHLAASWRPEDGELYVAPSGFEDSTHWHIIAGAREALVDDDATFVRLDAPAYLIDKTTGDLVLLDVIPNFEKLQRMTPVAS